MKLGEYKLRRQRDGSVASLRLTDREVIVVIGKNTKRHSIKIGQKPADLANPILLDLIHKEYEVSDVETNSEKDEKQATEAYKPSAEDYFAEIVTIENQTAIIDASEIYVDSKTIHAIVAGIFEKKLQNFGYVSIPFWIRSLIPRLKGGVKRLPL